MISDQSLLLSTTVLNDKTNSIPSDNITNLMCQQNCASYPIKNNHTNNTGTVPNHVFFCINMWKRIPFVSTVSLVYLIRGRVMY